MSEMLISHGAAPYENDPKNPSNYFVTTRDAAGGEKTYWGVDLERAIEESDIEIGDKIALRNAGKKNVQVTTEDEDGVSSVKSVHRNAWSLTKVAEVAETESHKQQAHSRHITHQPQQIQSQPHDMRTAAARDRLRQQVTQNTLQSLKNQDRADKVMRDGSERINQRFEKSFDDVLSAIRNPDQKSTRSHLTIHAPHKRSSSKVANALAETVRVTTDVALLSAGVVMATPVENPFNRNPGIEYVVSDLNPLLNGLKNGLNSGFVSVHDAHGAGLLSQIITTPSGAGDALSDRLRWNAMQMLLEYGADPAAIGRDGRSALHEAAANPNINPKLLHAMLLRQPDVSGCDAQGMRAIDLAILSGNTQAMSMLLSAGARDNDPAHPLSRITTEYMINNAGEPQAHARYEEMLRMLRANGVDLDAELDERWLRSKIDDERFVDEMLLIKKRVQDEEVVSHDRENPYDQIIEPSVSNGFYIEGPGDFDRTDFDRMPGGKLINNLVYKHIEKLQESIKANVSIAMNGIFFDLKTGEIKPLPEMHALSDKRLTYKKMFGYGSDYWPGERVHPAMYFEDLATNPLKKDIWPYVNINQALSASPHGDTVLMHSVRTGDIATVRAILSLPPELQPDMNKLNERGETAALLAVQRGDIAMSRLLLGVVGPNGTITHAPEAPDSMKRAGNLTNRNMVFQNGLNILQEAHRWASFAGGTIQNVDGSLTEAAAHENSVMVEQMIAELGFARPDWKPAPKAAVSNELKPDAALLNPRMSDAALREPVNKEDLRRLARNFAEHSQQLIVNIDKIRHEVSRMPPGHDQDVAHKAADDLRQALFDNVARAKPEVVIAAFQMAVHDENYKTANLLLDTIKQAIEARPSVSNPWAEAVLPVDWHDPDFYTKNQKNPSKYLSPLQTSIIDLTTIKTSSASPEREEEIAELEKRMEFLQHATMGPNGYILQDVHAKTHDPKVAAQIEEQLRAWESGTAPKPS